MTDPELKAHFEVLSVAIASLAVQENLASYVTSALKALVDERPSLSSAAGALSATLEQAEKSRHDAEVARMVQPGFFG